MPDHFHLLVTLERDITIERAVQFVTGGFAFRTGRELGFLSPVLRKGFLEVRILDAEELQGVTKYIHNNAVARPLVSETARFSCSSTYPGFKLDAAAQGPKPVCSSASQGIAKARP